MLPNYRAIYNRNGSPELVNFKQNNDVPFAPFHVLCDFVREAATTLNDPSFSFEKYDTWKPNQTPSRKVNVKKTDFTVSPNCSIHNAPHTLNQCRNFRKKALKERKQILRDNNLCYKCCESTTDVYKSCDANMKCSECGSEKHNTALCILHLSTIKPIKEPLQDLTVGSHSKSL